MFNCGIFLFSPLLTLSEHPEYLSLDLFYEEVPEFNNIISEIPMNNLSVNNKLKVANSLTTNNITNSNAIETNKITTQNVIFKFSNYSFNIVKVQI